MAKQKAVIETAKRGGHVEINVWPLYADGTNGDHPVASYRYQPTDVKSVARVERKLSNLRKYYTFVR